MLGWKEIFELPRRSCATAGYFTVLRWGTGEISQRVTHYRSECAAPCSGVGRRRPGHAREIYSSFWKSFFRQCSRRYHISTFSRAQGVFLRKVRLDLILGLLRKQRMGIRRPISSQPCSAWSWVRRFSKVIPCRGSRGCCSGDGIPEESPALSLRRRVPPHSSGNVKVSPVSSIQRRRRSNRFFRFSRWMVLKARFCCS